MAEFGEITITGGSDKIGIQETLKLINGLGNLIEGIDEMVEDGVNIKDIFTFFKLISSSKQTFDQFKNIKEIGKELKDLQSEEVMQIGLEVLKIIQAVLD